MPFLDHTLSSVAPSEPRAQEKVFRFLRFAATITPHLVSRSYLMSTSTSEESSSDSEVGTSSQLSPKRGTNLASGRKSAFEPPEGAVLIGGLGGDAGAVDTGEFDWDSVKDDQDIELWLVRVPKSVRLFPNLSQSPSPSPSLSYWIFHWVLLHLASISRIERRTWIAPGLIAHLSSDIFPLSR